MLRSFLIYLSKAAWAQKLMTSWGIAWRVASRFVAGVTVGEAIRAVKELNENCINATLDQLGEHTSTIEEADRATEGILRVLDDIEKAGVRANVSIKLTQIGMGLDEEICRQNLARILEQVKKHGNFLRIDMEDTPYTDTTLAIFHSMLQRGFSVSQVGMVVQSYLYRTEADVRKLLEYNTHLRLVKGAYKEPSEKAFPKKTDVDANFDLLTKLMIDAACKIVANKISADGRVPPIPAIATHDEKRIDFARQYAEKVGLPKEALEFQMLYGIRRDLQDRLVKEGYPVRIYVPFGAHWYPYFMRRLAERPANIWFFVSNFFRK
jgi:proline dehydrogenase